MLRVETQKKLNKIFEMLLQLLKYISLEEKAENRIFIQESKMAIEAIKDKISKEVTEADDYLVQIENIYKLFQELEQDNHCSGRICQQIEEGLVSLCELIKREKAVYQVFFFPYKAEMWDSLESIWLSCKDDIRCECKVVPIPYYHYDAKLDEWIYCYEIERFPDYVPVVNYKEYSLEENPDVAFIHNPYDKYNRVTNVLEDYYSYNLKKYVKHLFYVPYYVTSGFISKEHEILSAYFNADYLIVQSEVFKKGLNHYDFQNKALVMGSPKIDKVIRLSAQKQSINSEWNNIVGSKKSLMLNTSLGCFLNDSEAYLRKLRYVFERFDKRRDVALIWRPHPLLQSTIESLRSHLLSVYSELKEFFIQKKIGILDTTPDVVNTVSFVDGYIGEQSSSVINLFQAAAKPLFILNNYIFESGNVIESSKAPIWSAVQSEDVTYAMLFEFNGLFKVDYSKNKLVLIHELEKEAIWLNRYRNLFVDQEYIYIMPFGGTKLLRYDILSDKMETIWEEPNGNELYFSNIVQYKNKICYVPFFKRGIIEYDLNTNVVTEHREPVEALISKIEGMMLEEIYASTAAERYIWATTLYSNRVLCYDMETSKHIIYEIGSEENTYSAITVIGDMVYLAEARTGDIIAWNKVNLSIASCYRMPREFRFVPDVQGRYRTHYKLVNVGKYLLAIPFLANAIVKINLETGKVSAIMKPLGEDVFKNTNNYRPSDYGVVLDLGMKEPGVIRIQRTWDKAVIELNVETEEYHEYYLTLEEELIQKRLKESDGFEKYHRDFEFARRESPYYTLDGFLDDLVNENLEDAMKRQLQEMQTMAVNLDGTCGEKVHEFMMNVLDEEMA